MTRRSGTAIFKLVHDHGTFVSSSAVPASSSAASDQPDLVRPDFARARRGYDQSAVDAHLTRLEENAAALRVALEDSERRRGMAEEHALAVEDEIRAVRAGALTAPAVAAADTGFGARAERLLRLAETEAEQIRSVAQRSASELTRHAANEAERHQHEVQQRLIAESARAEEQTGRRAAALEDREQALQARIGRAQAEAETIRSAAQQAAEAHRSAAQAEVAELRQRSAYELGRTREREERELARLRDLQATARRELTRLASTIRAELPARVPRPSPGPVRGAGRAAAPGDPTGGQSAGSGVDRGADPGLQQSNEAVAGAARRGTGATTADVEALTGWRELPVSRPYPEVAAVATS